MPPQPTWSEADQWQRDNTRAGVKFYMENPSAPASALYDKWKKEVPSSVSVYGVSGPIDTACFVPFDKLPGRCQFSGYIFKQVVNIITEST